MPFADLQGVRLHYQLEGPENAPAILFSNSLGADLSMWSFQAEVLNDRFRIVRYDSRGHGRSAVLPGPYSIAMLAEDARALLDHIGLSRVHFCGLSLGGLTGIWLALNHPEYVDKLVLANTFKKIGTAERWRARADQVRQSGMCELATQTMERWFGAGFRSREPEKVALSEKMVRETDPDGYINSCAAIRDADSFDLTKIQQATLIISGEYDEVTTAVGGELMKAMIPGSRHLVLKAAHLSNMERPVEFTGALRKFLEGDYE